jgi:hypothetical protein
MAIVPRPPAGLRQFADFRRGVPHGGLFMRVQGDSAPARRYDPMAEADALLRAATRVNPDDPAALLAFVNEWGLLGVGLWGNKRGPFDSVLFTRERVKQVQAHVRWLRALRKGDWRSRDLPTLDHARGQAEIGAPRRPGPVSRGDRERRHWQAFGASLDRHLRGIYPAIGWDRDAGAIPAWTASRLIEVLWATVWDWATRGGSLRRCPHCQAFFPAEDPRKQYCSRECVNRASAAKWYQKTGRRLRRNRRMGRA